MWKKNINHIFYIILNVLRSYTIALIKPTYLHNLVFIMAMKKLYTYKSNRPHIYQMNIKYISLQTYTIRGW